MAQAGTPAGRGLFAAVCSVGEVAELGEQPVNADVPVVEAGIVLHLSHDRLAATFGHDSDLHLRLCRNLIHHLCERLRRAKDRRSGLSEVRAELTRDPDAAECDLNDARILASMR